MELFRKKKKVAKKIDSANNWKTAWPRMILEWHLFLELSIGFVWKNVEFIRKTSKFLPKRCLCRKKKKKEKRKKRGTKT